MNEPDELQPPVRADDSARSAPGFGYALAQARVRAGLSLEQTAARIRLHPRQLRALENEDLSALPSAAYVAGFVRNYARELKIDAGPLVEDLNAKLRLSGLGTLTPDLGPSGMVQLSVLDDRGWRHLVLAGIVIALVCAGLIGVWMAQPGLHLGGVITTRAQAPAPASAAATQAAPAGAGVVAAAPPTTGATGAQKNVNPEMTRHAGALATGTAAPVAANAPAAPADAGALPPVESAGSTAASAAAAEASRVPATELVLTPVPGATTGLVLHFNDRSWVEVSQPDGRVLLSRNGEAGTIELLDANPPLVLTVGRAEAVQVEYRGRTVNLKPYVNNNGVARLTLADGPATSGGQNR